MHKGKSYEKVSGEKEPAGSAPGKSEKEKDGTKLPTRIIVRNLPPTMTEEQFLEQTSPIPAHDDFYFAPPDMSLGANATSRAYIKFKKYDDVVLFRHRFDSYVFVDSRGWEYEAIVEIAPFQGFSANKTRKRDGQMNTIEDDPQYLQFLEKKKAQSKMPQAKLEFSLDDKKKDLVRTTPLLEYLSDRNKHSEEKNRKKPKGKWPLKGESASNEEKQINQNDGEKSPRLLQKGESTPSCGKVDHGNPKKWHGRQLYTNKSWGKAEEANLQDCQSMEAATHFRDMGSQRQNWSARIRTQRERQKDAVTAGPFNQRHLKFIKEATSGATPQPAPKGEGDTLPELLHQLKNLKVITKEEKKPSPMQVLNEEHRTQNKNRPSGSKEKEKPSVVGNGLNAQKDKKDVEQLGIWWKKRPSKTEVREDQAKPHDRQSNSQNSNVGLRKSEDDIRSSNSESRGNGNDGRRNSKGDKKSHNEN